GPQLTVGPVPEELVGRPRRARPGVEHTGTVRLYDQHRVGGLVAGVVGVGGVWPEPVVGVVGTHLESARRDHQTLAREGLGEPGAASSRPRGDRMRWQLQLAITPALAHEARPRLGYDRIMGLGSGGVGGHEVTVITASL